MIALFHFSLFVMLAVGVIAAEPAVISAKDLAVQLAAQQNDGSSYVRLKFDIKPAGGAAKIVLQLQIKQRRSANTTELVYQVLWPKERVGEAVLLRRSGDQSSGTVFIPPNTQQSLKAAQMKEPLFASALDYADVLENFFAWDHQKILGSEVVNRVTCQILESRPGNGQKSNAAAVRSWIDLKRLVPIRVVKSNAAGVDISRIETTRVVSDDMDRNLPANLTVTDLIKGTITELEGSKLKHRVKYDDAEFTPAGLNQMTPPAGE